MRPSFRFLGALDTRVGLRTFVLFGACALVPIALFAGWSYRTVSSELTEAAVARLGESSKRYGVLVNERLLVVEELLIERAQRLLHESAMQDTGASPFDSRFRLIRQDVGAAAAASADLRASELAQQPRLGKAAGLTRRLEIGRHDSASVVRLIITFTQNGRTATAVGELNPDYLWNNDASEMAEAVTCVQADGFRLHCTDGDDSVAASGRQDEQTLRAQWVLFLKPRYAVDEWVVTTEQSEGVALRSLHAFQKTLPFAAGLALSAALLLSLVQIRRSLGPLRILIAATRRLGRGRFGAHIRVSGRDEYASLARAFNRLSGRLKRQFQLRAAFSQLDQSILQHPAVEPMLGAMLPRMLAVLECDVAVAIVLRPDSEGSHLISIRRGANRACESQRVWVNEEELRALAANRVVPCVTLEASNLFRTPALSSCDCHAWHAAPVIVARQLRGVLLLGFAGARRVRTRTARHTADLARRLAVALSNEDRDRALIKQAYSDALTGLANRQLFRDRLERELERSRRHGTSGAVLFIDLDRFKHVNDSLGHSAGDQILKTAALRLQDLVRECDTLARPGGDEFTLICPELDPLAAGALAGQVLAALRVPEDLPGMRCVIQASIGIACFPQDGTSVETVVRNADTAMYRAKFSGGAQAVFFEAAMNTAAVRRLRVEQRLREALEAGRLTLHFQPKIGAKDGALVGAEALVRWQDPEDGYQSPAEFIKVAEECGLIVPLGTWVLDASCRLLKQWLDSGMPIGHVAVNVSVHQLRETGFPGIVQRCLERHGLPRGCLELEITESTVMEDVAAMAEVLRRVRELGVRIAIDDFGTGYSSLAVLQRLPVDILKIDRAFVSAIEQREGAALFDTLVAIGRALGKTTVVEGIETASQARFASEHGCEVLQGYFFGKPAAAQDFVRIWFPDHTDRTESAAQAL